MKRLILLIAVVCMSGCVSIASDGPHYMRNFAQEDALIQSQINYNNRVGVGRVPCERYDFTPTPILPSAIPQTPMNPGRSMGGPYTGNLGGIY